MIEQLAKEGMTMIIVIHEVAFAHEVADLIAFMSDCVIVESGPPGQIFEHPENPRARGFLARFHRFMGSFSAPPKPQSYLTGANASLAIASLLIPVRRALGCCAPDFGKP